MAGRTYKARGIILRKAKLRESDSIVTLISSHGERIEAVAHGARRPGSSFSGRMELFSEVDIVCAKGRSLDVVSDSRIVAGTLRRFGLDQSMAAAPIAELLAAIAQTGLKQEKLYGLAQATFAAIADADPDRVLSYTAAGLLKICSVAGFRPVLDRCVICGNDIGHGAMLPFSNLEGGTVCLQCPRPHDARLADGNALGWAHALLYARYSEIEGFEGAQRAASDVIPIARLWIQAHIGCRMKSLDVLMSCGLQDMREERIEDD